MTDLEASQKRVRAAMDELDAAVRARDKAVRSGRDECLSAIEIADRLGVDRQMVYRILKRK